MPPSAELSRLLLAARLAALAALTGGEAEGWWRVVAAVALVVPAGFVPPLPLAPALRWAAGIAAAGLAAFGGPLPAAAALAGLAIPASGKILVFWDGDCGFCARSKRLAQRLAEGRIADWEPFQGGRGGEYGISDEALAARLHTVSPTRRIRSGYDALRVLALHFPVVWYAVIIAVALGPRLVVLGAVALAVTPVTNPLGEPLYGWVARNRHRLGPVACTLPGPAAPGRGKDQGQRT